MAAALAELAARYAGDDDAVAHAHGLVARLRELADEDARAYEQFLRSPDAETRRRTIEIPQAVAGCADEAGALAARLAGSLRSPAAADAEAGAALARAAAAVARRLAELNARA